MDTNPTTTTSVEEVKQEAEDITGLFDWIKLKPRLTLLLDRFRPEIEHTNFNRITRYVDLSIKELRDKGKLKTDETTIPIRLSDTNIRREQPAYISYLKQSKRLMTFTDLDDPDFVPDKIEEEFTRGMEYNGWEKPLFKEVDGAQTHGWDSVEVVIDKSKPFNLGIEHVGHENLIFEVDSIDIQLEEVVVRRYPTVTKLQLKSFVRDFDFDSVQADYVINKKVGNELDAPFCLYKIFFKAPLAGEEEKITYCGWFSMDCLDWLKAPRPYYLGLAEQTTIPSPSPLLPPETKWIPKPLTSFPLFILPYYETEKPRIMDHDGRVFLDKFKQEALTTGWTAFMNSLIRSSGVYACRANPTDPQGKAKIESIVLEHGKIITQDIKFFNLPYPAPEMLAALQALDVQNSQEVGQLTYAVNNRQDSRKTATEINQASQDQSLLSSVQMTLFSAHIRELYTFIWVLVKSQANQGLIKFLADPATGENDLASINRNFDLKAAGDTDVVKRQELLAKYMALLPVVAQTPIALPFIAKILKLSLYDDGEVFANMLMQSAAQGADQGKAIIQALVQLVQGMATPEELSTLKPEDRNNLEHILQTATTYLQQSQQQLGGNNGTNTGANTSNVGGGAGPINQPGVQAGTGEAPTNSMES